jgi:hypothetical protein
MIDLLRKNAESAQHEAELWAVSSVYFQAAFDVFTTFAETLDETEAVGAIRAIFESLPTPRGPEFAEAKEAFVHLQELAMAAHALNRAESEAHAAAIARRPAAPVPPLPVAHLSHGLDSAALLPFHRPGLEQGWTALEVPLGDEAYHVHIRRAHSDLFVAADEPARPANLDEIAAVIAALWGRVAMAPTFESWRGGATDI